VKDHIRLGALDIELKCKGKAFLGIGRISCGKTLLRAGDLPIRPFTATHDGIEYDQYEIEQVHATARRVTIRTRAIGKCGPVAALQDHSLDPVWSIRSWEGGTAVVDRMDWILESGERKIGGQTFRGFWYSFRFHSSEREIYYILDRATWELGGDANGVTMLRQQMGTDPKVTLARNTAYCTSARIPFPLNPIMTHDVPRWASEQGFDYQYKAGAALVGVFKSCGLIRTIITRDAGDRSIRHFDKHMFDQTRDAQTTPKFIGYCEGVGGDTDQINLWTRVFDVDQDNVLSEFGMKRTYPRTTMGHNFWLNFTADSYRKDLLPAASALGFQQVFIDTFWENDMTRMKDGTLASFFAGNMCCPHEYEVSNAVGGIPAYRRLARDAKKMGLEVISWVGSHQSQHSPYLIKNREQVIKGPDGRHFYGSGYDAIYGMDLSTKFGPMFRDAIVKSVKNTGVSGFLYDSFYNFGWMPVNYETLASNGSSNGSQHHGRLAVHSQWRQLAKIMAALQKAGVHMLIESLGPWGQPQHGVQGAYNRPGSEPLAYQCSACTGYSAIPIPGAKQSEMNGPEVYYRLLANKAPMTLNLFINDPKTGKPARLDRLAQPLLRQANMDYRTVLPRMHTRTILPGNAGVLWKPARGKSSALFSYKRQRLPLARNTKYTDLKTGKAGVVGSKGLAAEAFHTYALD